MARRSLKPQLNQIRAWVQQGRTDAWIAHQLEISAQELREFRKQYDLNPDEENAGGDRGRDRSRRGRKAGDRGRGGRGRGARGPLRGRRGRRGRSPAPATPRPPWRARPAQRDRGDLRPRRRGRLRPLAGRLGQGQPRLQGQLGRQARSHRPHRGRPDRHPPGRRAQQQRRRFLRVRRLGRVTRPRASALRRSP